MKETEFLFDDGWAKREKELKDILGEIKSPELEKNTYVLKTFVRSAAYVFVRKEKVEKKLFFNPLLRKHFEKKEEISVVGGEELMKPKYYTQAVNIPAGVEVYPVPVPSVKGSKQPVLEFKEVPQFTKKIVRRPVPGKKRKKRKHFESLDITVPETTKDLITDKITNKVLATAKISDRYIVNEPGLDSVDIDVLMKIKKKRLKNMEKGWNLIQKYGKKIGIKEGHDTLIKYYIVNDFFGLGRIEPLLQDKEITSVNCEGVGKNIKIIVNGKNLETNISFLNKGELLEFVYGAANRIGLELNKKNKTAKGMFRGFEFTLNLGEDLQSPSFKVERK